VVLALIGACSLLGLGLSRNPAQLNVRRQM
jgi:hypothetical protein